MARSRMRAFLGLAALLLLTSCTEMIRYPDGRPYDPYEKFNRDVYGFNTWVDVHAVRPVAVGYRDYVPGFLQRTIHNILQNLNTPYVMVNEALQGDFHNAAVSFWRLVVNSTAGLGGMVDVASYAGVQPLSTGFGHTLAVYGVGHGPFLVLPLIGPSTPRETIGYGADAAGDPLDYFIPFPAAVGEGATGIIDQRSRYIDQIDRLRANSVDEYAAARSLYLQHLQAMDNQEGSQRGPTSSIPDYKDPATGTTK